MPPKLDDKEQLALREFRKALEKAFGNDLLEVKLFGSKARGDARKDSDLDVLVVISSGDWRMRDVVYGIVTDILLEGDVCISPKVISKAHYDRLREAESPFIGNVIRDGVPV
ncbi:MAG: nucleotidyltransferase domain-containing protein [Planctomycetes bacterium]|nr:nucleotidyltransferase domain-containing protein [Planctomycetota bacterium]MBM4079204.1 nucleotidyltransferase domain-containing protein [Planctomycetota bacterium]MBM4084675.1 nucleotidyltransferase domain-containing protein [Planctomycetota bacterium]